MRRLRTAGLFLTAVLTAGALTGCGADDGADVRELENGGGGGSPGSASGSGSAAHSGSGSADHSGSEADSGSE